MDIAVFSPAELPFVFAALAAAATGGAPPQAEDQRFLAACETVLGTATVRTDADLITPATIADGVRGTHARKRLLQLAGIAALVHRPVRAGSAAYLGALAQALGTRDPIVSVVDALARGRRGRARLLCMRRMLRVLVKEAYQSQGVRGVLRVFGALWFKLAVDKDQLWSHKRLGLLPEGTLGREYWSHMTRVGFGFPGERGGIPQVLAYHDVGHVLTGYSTVPEGELQQGAFQAGCRREDGFVFLQFVVLQFHQGLQLTPAAQAESGLLDPDRLLRALYRGSQCAVDITHRWSYWHLMPMPLGEVRTLLNLQPSASRRRPGQTVARPPALTAAAS